MHQAHRLTGVFVRDIARRIGLRLASIAVLCASALAIALPMSTAEAATVGDCATITSLSGVAHGKIRWSGMSQCFSMFLEHGYTYTITVDAGDRSYAYSSNIYEPLGDSVLALYRSNPDRIQVNDPFNAAYFDFVAVNDDYALPAHLGSRITYEVTGDPGRTTLFIAHVSGFSSAVGTYSISLTRSVVADIDGCDNYFACQ